jgi:hypothetical protein
MMTKARRSDDKRLRRATGIYSTYDELFGEVMRLKRGKNTSQVDIANRCGISEATVIRIIRESRDLGIVRPIPVDLNSMFDRLWRRTETCTCALDPDMECSLHPREFL